MLLIWKIRYLDTSGKQFKDRILECETELLDPVAKAAIEVICEMKVTGCNRQMLQYRHLFKETNLFDDTFKTLSEHSKSIRSFFIQDYFEDETGKELTSRQMATVLTGNPNSILLPPGAKQYDIDYILSDKRPIPIDQVILSQKQMNVLGYFARDLRELLTSTMYKDGHGIITGYAGNINVLKTAASDEEIRSFMTIFRRLYMKKEPANFVKVLGLFHDIAHSYPLGHWVQGISNEYQEGLKESPECIPMGNLGKLPFSRKRLIDVFLYTQYAHQPDGRRTHQYQECLAAVGGNRSLLTWLFLTEVWGCAIHMRNAGVVITNFYDRYRQYHNAKCEILASVRDDHPEIGKLEKKENHTRRILQEKAEVLAKTIWENEGRPNGGHAQFINQALGQISDAMRGKQDKHCP